MRKFCLSAGTLILREAIRFFRQRNRIIGALMTPLIFWLLVGYGFRSSFRLGSEANPVTSLEFLFPGAIVMILLFTSIFSNISIIEDRREGFLQSVLVAPISRFALVLGKVLGSTLIASLQGLIFLALVPLSGLSLTPGSFLLAFIVIVIISFALSGVGFLFAWRAESIQGFHVIMNLVLMPLWFLSGAFFPLYEAPVVLRSIMMINPLTYGVAALREVFYVTQPPVFEGMPNFGISLLAILTFGVVCVGLSGFVARQTIRADLKS